MHSASACVFWSWSGPLVGKNSWSQKILRPRGCPSSCKRLLGDGQRQWRQWGQFLFGVFQVGLQKKESRSEMPLWGGSVWRCTQRRHFDEHATLKVAWWRVYFSCFDNFDCHRLGRIQVIDERILEYLSPLNRMHHRKQNNVFEVSLTKSQVKSSIKLKRTLALAPELFQPQRNKQLHFIGIT